MYIKDYINIIGVSIFIGLGITIFSGEIIIGILSSIIVFFTTKFLRKKALKHDYKIQSKYIKESFKE